GRGDRDDRRAPTQRIGGPRAVGRHAPCGARGDGTGGGGRRHSGGRTSAAHDPRSRRRPVAGAAPLGVGRGAVVDPRRVVAGGGGTHRGGLRPFGAAGPGRPG